MKKQGMTNRGIWEMGEHIRDWACDINPITGETESNGGIQHLMEFEGERYLVITDWDQEVVLNPTMKCQPQADFYDIRK